MSSFSSWIEKEIKGREEILTHINRYLDMIIQAAKEFDSESRVLIFGSYVRGNFRLDSDIDVLIISDKYGKNIQLRATMYAHILPKLNVIELFEIHIASKELYEQWYKKFIDVYKEI